MKKLIAATGTLALLLVSVATAAERTVKLSVANMTCITCPLLVEHSLKRVPGVNTVEVSFRGHTAVVTFDDAVATVDDLIMATTDAGYPSSVMEEHAS